MNTRFSIHGRPVFSITEESGRLVIRDLLRNKTVATFADDTAAKQFEATMSAVFGQGRF